MKIQKMYAEHVATRRKDVAEMVLANSYDLLVIHAGTSAYYHADDQEIPFRTLPHFRHWTPLEGPNHLLLIVPDKRPELIVVLPEDYWYEQTKLGDPFWAGEFEITTVGDVKSMWELMLKKVEGRRVVFIGDKASCEIAESRGIARNQINPEEVLKKLDESRTVKSEYEIFCIEEANKIAAEGHKRAHETFFAGGSELDIHHAFLVGAKQAEVWLPYPAITALDEKAAVLHYQNKRDQGGKPHPLTPSPKGRGEFNTVPLSLGEGLGVRLNLSEERGGSICLLDAGVSYLGYASDITRTWARPKADGRFVSMIQALDILQQELVAKVRPGATTLALHHEAHLGIAHILKSHGIIDIGGDEAIKTWLTFPFFPHGLGHFLGIQVHDVGVGNIDPSTPLGTPQCKSLGANEKLKEIYPNLRTVRTLVKGNVITIEPGIYFIPMLLSQLKAKESARHINWELVEKLTPCGGIRIEDNILVTKSGQRNLTRPHLE